MENNYKEKEAQPLYKTIAKKVAATGLALLVAGAITFSGCTPSGNSINPAPYHGGGGEGGGDGGGNGGGGET